VRSTATRRRRRKPEREPEWPILVTTPKTYYPAVALVQHTEVLRRTQSASPPGRSSLEVTECKFFTSPCPPLPQVRRLAARRPLNDAVRELLLRGAGCTAVGPPDRECRPLTQRPSAEAQCCLTLRSRGAPTARHQALATGTVYIVCGQGLASLRRRPLTSNVRRHRAHVLCSPIEHPKRNSEIQPGAMLLEALGLSIYSLSTACGAGFVCGAALLTQILLRNAVRDGLPGATRSLERLLLIVRLAAAAASMGLLFLFLLRFAPHNGGSDLQFWLVIVATVTTILLGLRQVNSLAARLRSRLLRS